MTRSRDIRYDVRVTKELLQKEHQITFIDPSWLDHKGKGAILDYELLKGATLEQLVVKSGRKPSAVNAHIYHLKKEHGLNIVKTGDVYKIGFLNENSEDNSFSDVKIGVLVKNYIYKIFHYCEMEDREELNRLMDLSYSKRVFGINFPFCKLLTDIDTNEIVRFWKADYNVQGKDVRVCSQWYASSKPLFLAYLFSKNIISEYEFNNYNKYIVNDLNVENSVNKNYKTKNIPPKRLANKTPIQIKKSSFSIDLNSKIGNDLRLEAEEMSKYYEIFYSLERSIRFLIENVMETRYGKDWWENKVDYRVRENVKRNMEYELDTPHTKRSEHYIDYSTFGDLRKIINTNWHDFQSKFNRNLTSVNEILIDLNRLRVPIAHCTPLANKEVKRLELRIEDWYDLLKQ